MALPQMAPESEQTSFDIIFRANCARAVALAAHVGGDRAGAEDLVQDVFWQLHETQCSETIMNPAAWVRPPAERCDLVLAVGTTLNVFPAAHMTRVAQRAGARLVIVNGAPTDHRADAVLRGSTSEILPALVGIPSGP